MIASRNLRIVIGEMLDHIDYIQTKIANLSASEFGANRDARQIVERSLEIISEASRQPPMPLKERRADIPWKQIANLGNVLRHTYHAVSATVVWHIVTEELGALRTALRDMGDQLTE